MTDRYYRARGKRLLDLAVSIPFLAITAPVLVGVLFVVWAGLGRPVLFSQRRPGLHGKPFLLRKCRTMQEARDQRGEMLSDGERLGRLGRAIRASSLDELPTLWNVIRGDMSLVGPRPLLMRYLERYTPTQMRRHEVKPGITGWAQVNGRNALTWEERFALDVWYVDHVSFWLDLRILARTIWKTLKREGISQPGCATMDEFLGQQPD
jgi:sugar transferase EpsL